VTDGLAALGTREFTPKRATTPWIDARHRAYTSK
jgi:hypothetical protein